MDHPVVSQKIIDWTKDRFQGEVILSKEAQGDRSSVFKVAISDDEYFLKVGQNLTPEYKHLKWLEGKLPVPKAIDFTSIDDRDVLLLSGIKGKNLKVLVKEWSPDKVVNEIADAIRKFHRADTEGYPFGMSQEGDVLIHGDASLPNFIFENDALSGYIDLGDMTLGNKEVDFAAAIWSLEYNLGKGYGKMFLERYGVTNVTEEMVEKLRLIYEDMQEAWGL